MDIDCGGSDVEDLCFSLYAMLTRAIITGMLTYTAKILLGSKD